MNCLLQAACRAFHVGPDDIIKFLGHNGEAPLDQLGHPPGFHIQEIIRYADIMHKRHLCPVEPEFGICTPGRLIVSRQHRDYYNMRIDQKPAILEGYTRTTGHAAYWDGYKIYDTKPDQNFQVTCAWLIL